MRQADRAEDDLLAAETHSLSEAARAYRIRRGRHPPPDFDKWHKFAEEHDVAVIEPFFDQIYKNLEPFWSLSPQFLRDFPKEWTQVITVRTGRPLVRSQHEWGWLYYWVAMLQALPPLPDVDLAVWPADEPRTLVPFSKIEEHMADAAKIKLRHNEVPLQDIRNTWPEYPIMDYQIQKEEPEKYKTSFANSTLWDLLITACRPDDPAVKNPQTIPQSNIPPVFSTDYTAGTVKGYVANYSIARNPCHNPNLRTLHGFLINPNSQDVYTELVPIFAAANVVGVTNNILIPPPTHFGKKLGYAALENVVPWKQKKDAIVWRGTATGGNHTKDNWWGFHRHRLIQLLNGTAQTRVEQELAASGINGPSIQELQIKYSSTFELGLHNFPFPLRKLYPIAAQAYAKLGKWIGSLSDGGFVNMYCSPSEFYESGIGGTANCTHTDDYYSLVPRMNMSEMFTYKYLPDVDGFSTSGRFMAFLKSLSLPIKSSIFTEWHDDRLIPWRHFVPMSAEYQEWWGLIQYFLGYQGEEGEVTIPGHDEVAEKIARQGSEWSRHIESRPDVLVYFYRVILEYARICADDRVQMGFVDDLL